MTWVVVRDWLTALGSSVAGAILVWSYSPHYYGDDHNMVLAIFGMIVALIGAFLLGRLIIRQFRLDRAKKYLLGLLAMAILSVLYLLLRGSYHDVTDGDPRINYAYWMPLAVIRPWLWLFAVDIGMLSTLMNSGLFWGLLLVSLGGYVTVGLWNLLVHMTNGIPPIMLWAFVADAVGVVLLIRAVWTIVGELTRRNRTT